MKYKLLSSLFYSDKDLYESTYKKRISSESTYVFDFKIHNNNSFLVLNNEVLNLIDDIISFDKQLYKIINDLPDIALFKYKHECIISEVKTTNDIEGVHSTRKEISDIINDKDNKLKNKRLFGIVKKYEMLFENNNIDLVTCSDIRNLYNDIALQDVLLEDKNNTPDGEFFRTDTVDVTNQYGKVVHSGIIYESEIINHMNIALSILNNNTYNFLIRIAVFHYMFGYIHPFYDGNGRTSRFISSYLLSQKLEKVVSYNLSTTIRNNLGSYGRIFNTTNDIKNKGDMTSFVIYFLSTIKDSIVNLCDYLGSMRDKITYYKNIIPSLDFNDSISSILFVLIQNDLFGGHHLGIYELSAIFDVSSTTARKHIKTLIDSEFVSVSKNSNKHFFNVNFNKFDNI